MARLLRRLHRLHRALGSVLCVLMASWFLSGAVMTFAGYPYYSEALRRRDLPPLGPLAIEALPESLLARLQAFIVEPGSELSLTRPMAAPRLALRRMGETVTTLALESEAPLPAISEQEARGLSARVVGAPVRSIEQLDESDQWSVPLPQSLFPLFHVSLADRAGSELYLSRASGEIVQRTTRKDRLLAWVGAIPHWIYPTLLRRERDLWRNLVIALAVLGFVLTSAGLVAGLDTAQRLRRGRARRGLVLNDRALRFHQRIGLAFGALALCWLFSGILSFNPLDWTRTRGLAAQAEQRLRGTPGQARAPLQRLPLALAACQRELQVSELRVRYLASRPFASCLAQSGERRVVMLDQDALQVERELPRTLLDAAARALAGPAVRFAVERVDRADQYYYPTHTEPDLVLPCIRVAAEDSQSTTYYLDPYNGELLRALTARSRLERFLYHGLHSWDFAFLYRQRGLWHALVLLAMSLGASLSLLGVGLSLRRVLRRRRKLRRQRERAREAGGDLDTSGQSVG